MSCCAYIPHTHTDINDLVSKIVEEVSALESRGGEHGAENSDYTFLAAVETAPQFSCPVCGNKVLWYCSGLKSVSTHRITCTSRQR